MHSVSDFAMAGDLTGLVDALACSTPPIVPEKTARRVFRQLLLAVEYCHRLGVANRDIKARSQPVQEATPRCCSTPGVPLQRRPAS